MKVNEIITDIIIKKLESGNIPWIKPWNNCGEPKNIITNKEYRGINNLLLSFNGYSNPFYLTINQAKQLKIRIKYDEMSKGHLIVFWKTNTIKDKNNEDIEKTIPMLRYYKVWNLEQCESIPEKYKTPEIPSLEFNPIETCENIISEYKDCPEIISDNKAYYSVGKDIIGIPNKSLFKSIEDYYSTLFHEMIHSTGNKKRLDRKSLTTSVKFGSEIYSKEELIAEIGNSFLCGYSGIMNKTIDNSSAYISSWIKVLKSDNNIVISSASYAQKAFDYIVGDINDED